MGRTILAKNVQYYFGPFRFDPLNCLLWHGRKSEHLQPKACQLLCLFLENAGNTITKQAIEGALWGEENYGIGLTFQINALRNAFGKYGDKYRQYILTEHRRGYRFTKIPASGANDAVDEQPPSLPEDPTHKLEKSLAVLPFVANDKKRDEHLQDFMTYGITAKLGEVSQLLVTPLKTVRSFTEKIQDSIEVGRTLEVEALVEGSIQRVGTRIRGMIRLLRVADGAQLWTRTFDVKFDEILRLQASVSEEVAEQLIRVLTREQRSRIAKQDTENPEAYDLYVRGRSQWNRRSNEGLESAIDCFKRAIQMDPDYSMAYAGLADAYNLRSYYSGVKPSDTFLEAVSWADRALAIDPTLAEAYTSRAYAISRCFWNWDQADREYKKAIALKPNYATSHQWYAEYLTAMGRFDEAIREANRALELDRHSPIVNAALGTVLYFSRRYDEAIRQYRRTIKKSPDFIRTHFRLARVLIQKNRFAEAIKECQEGIKLSGNETREIAQLGQAYAAAGKESEALQVLRELEKLSTEFYVSEYNIAIIYLGLGDNEQALTFLYKAYFSHDPWLEHLKVDPRLDPLRVDSRFQELLRMIKLIA